MEDGMMRLSGIYSYGRCGDDETKPSVRDQHTFRIFRGFFFISENDFWYTASFLGNCSEISVEFGGFDPPKFLQRLDHITTGLYII